MVDMQRSCADVATTNAESFVRSWAEACWFEVRSMEMNDLGFMHMDAMVAWESYMEGPPRGQ